LIHFLYDGSFEGLLTAVFDVYDRKAARVRIIPQERYQPDAFADRVDVVTDENKANRVWRGLQKKLSPGGLTNLFSLYLSERPDREDLLLAFCRMAFTTDEKVEENFYSPVVLQVAQIGKQLHREKHRFEAFVRFVQLADGTYFATIDPDFDVLPLITPHFRDRYADQLWIIYDTRRRYGIHYDGQTVQEVRFDFLTSNLPSLEAAGTQAPAEDLYQQLWQVYFRSVNIPARRNMKLHRQHVPVRYWKYLPEKRNFFSGEKGGSQF
jgi:probable DNA metabolism protein